MSNIEYRTCRTEDARRDSNFWFPATLLLHHLEAIIGRRRSEIGFDRPTLWPPQLLVLLPAGIRKVHGKGRMP